MFLTFFFFLLICLCSLRRNMGDVGPHWKCPLCHHLQGQVFKEAAQGETCRDIEGLASKKKTAAASSNRQGARSDDLVEISESAQAHGKGKSPSNELQAQLSGSPLLQPGRRLKVSLPCLCFGFLQIFLCAKHPISLFIQSPASDLLSPLLGIGHLKSCQQL